MKFEIKKISQDKMSNLMTIELENSLFQTTQKEKAISKSNLHRVAIETNK